MKNHSGNSSSSVSPLGLLIGLAGGVCLTKGIVEFVKARKALSLPQENPAETEQETVSVAEDSADSTKPEE